MKKLLTLILVTTMVFAFAACGSGSSSDGSSGEKEGLKIAVLCYEMCEATNISVDRIQELADEQGIELDVKNAQWDASVQLSQIEDSISAGVDGIILMPTDSDAMVPAISMCEDAGMPLIVTNNSLNTDQPYYYVGAEEEEAGYMEAKALAEAMGGKGNIVILQCILGTGYEVGRTKGYERVFEEYPDIKVLDAQPANGQRDVSMELMENWIEAYGSDINGVLSQCDEMSIGAIMALQNANLLDGVKVVGIDGTSNGLTEVKEGRMVMTCMQDLSYIGETSLEYVLQLINGETPSPEKDIIDMIPIDQSQAADYLSSLYGM